MGLADTLKAGPPLTVRKCGVQNWLDLQPTEARTLFAEITIMAIEHIDGWNVQKLHDVCRDNGLTLNRDALGKHLRGRCPCGTRR